MKSTVSFQTSLRTAAAWLLLLIPVFAYPLVWVRLWEDSVPYWSDAVAFNLPQLALVALGVIIAFPVLLREGWRQRISVRLAVAGAVLVLLNALIQQFVFGGSWEFFGISAFYVFLPLAGIALAPELKRAFPIYGVIAFVVLTVFTFRSKLFVGFPGNWNWNMAMLSLMFPACFLFMPKAKRRLWYAVAGELVVMGIFSLMYYSMAPRGVMLGMVGSMGLLWILRRVTPNRRVAVLLAAFAVGFLLFCAFTLSHFAEAFDDSRIQLWRGSLDFAIVNGLFGTGPGRFSSMVQSWIPWEYFTTPYLAEHHPHPHNETLSYLAGFGLAGVFFITAVMTGVAKRLRRRDPVGMWLAWVVFTLFFHGQFDVLLAMPLTGSIFLLAAGALLGNGLPRPTVSESRFPGVVLAVFAGAALLLASAEFSAGRYLRQARILLMHKEVPAAYGSLERSCRKKATAGALYLRARVELFDLRDPVAAIDSLKKLQALGYADYEHSNQLRARAMAAAGDPVGALYWFRREDKNFPFSAINAGLELQVLEALKQPEELLAARRRRFAALMQLRGLAPGEFKRLLKNPTMDDTRISRQAAAGFIQQFAMEQRSGSDNERVE